jgi:superfamily II DNA/RNA helicase
VEVSIRRNQTFLTLGAQWNKQIRARSTRIMREVRNLTQILFLSLFVCLAALGRVSGLVKGPFLDLRTFVTKYRPTTALGDSSSSSVFAGVRFDEPIASSLKALNIHEPSPIQEQAIFALSTGLSCIIHAETGSGKTLCYLLPLLKRLVDEKKKNDNDNSKIVSIIVVPSKELAVQVAADVASMMGQSDEIDTRLVHLCLESGRAGLDSVRAPIVIGTPYKLLDAVRNAVCTVPGLSQLPGSG